MNCYRKLASAGIVVLALAGAVLGNSNGEFFEALTGAPGESTCADCHGDLNSGPGSLVITAPAGYAPGDTLVLSVGVQHTGQSSWGFELTVLDASDQPIGEILVTDAARMVKSTALSGREYIKQTSLGTDTATHNSTGWEFKWVAPASDAGPVTFYAAGVAANEASGPNGDFVYSTTHVMLLTDVSELEIEVLPSSFELVRNFPNPFNPSTTIEFRLPQRSPTEITVFNVLGQKVLTLFDGELPAGAYSVEWQGTDKAGRSCPSGTYFCRLTAGDFRAVAKMLLLK